MRINWQRLGITIIGIIVIAGIFFTSIYWDPTGLIERESHIAGKIGMIFINVILVAVPTFVSLMLLVSICKGIYNLFKWITDIPEPGAIYAPILEPGQEPVIPQSQSELIEPKLPELDEVIPRTSLLDLS